MYRSIHEIRYRYTDDGNHNRNSGQGFRAELGGHIWYIYNNNDG